MFEAFRDDMYGRRNRIVALVLAAGTVGVGGIAWLVDGLIHAVVGVIVIATVAWLAYWVVMLQHFDYVVRSEEAIRDARKRGKPRDKQR